MPFLRLLRIFAAAVGISFLLAVQFSFVTRCSDHSRVSIVQIILNCLQILGISLLGISCVRNRDTIGGRWVLVQVMLGVGLVCAFPEGVAADGPLVVTPYLAVSEQYNDNIFFTTSHTGDFVTSITPGLSLQYQQPRLVLSLSGGTSAQIYAQQTSQNNIAGAQSGALSATYQASERLSLSVSDSVSRVSQTRTGYAAHRARHHTAAG